MYYNPVRKPLGLYVKSVEERASNPHCRIYLELGSLAVSYRTIGQPSSESSAVQ